MQDNPVLEHALNPGMFCCLTWACGHLKRNKEEKQLSGSSLSIIFDMWVCKFKV